MPWRPPAAVCRSSGTVRVPVRGAAGCRSPRWRTEPQPGPCQARSGHPAGLRGQLVPTSPRGPRPTARDPAPQRRGTGRWSGSRSARQRWRPCARRGVGRHSEGPPERSAVLPGLTAGTRPRQGARPVPGRALHAPGPAEPGRRDLRHTAVADPPNPRPRRPSGFPWPGAASARLRRRAGREARALAHCQPGVAPRHEFSAISGTFKREAIVGFRRWLVTDYRKVYSLPGPHGTSARMKRRALIVTTLAVTCATVLSGCGASAKRGFLPQGVTSESGSIINLWTGSWLAALGVGVLVWGLILWCVVVYRRKKNDVGLPEQLRYNVPIEILYTVVPMFMIAVLFFYTAKLETPEMDVSQKPDITINVVAKQWNWDFNYIDARTYETSSMVTLTGQPGVAATLPSLYLPVNKRVEFVLTSRDVIHSFWVPQFLRKLDVIPGKVNRFQVVPTEIGTFQGKCAELCGAYHSAMLFQVKVVSMADYQAHMADLRAKGNIGMLSNSLSREKIQPSQQQYLPTNGSK